MGSTEKDTSSPPSVGNRLAATKSSNVSGEVDLRGYGGVSICGPPFPISARFTDWNASVPVAQPGVYKPQKHVPLRANELDAEPHIAGTSVTPPPPLNLVGLSGKRSGK
ncbi:hypothetical protein MTO96_050112 [Rhipicephalus appendiculatus]